MNAYRLRQRAFFLNHEGTFGSQEGMINECLSAKTETFFLNHEGTFGSQEGMIT